MDERTAFVESQAMEGRSGLAGRERDPLALPSGETAFMDERTYTACAGCA
jgi:hypothetical protein